MSEDVVEGRTATDEMLADEIDGSFVPVRRADVTTVELDGEAVVIREGTATPHYLNQIGTIVWDTFDGSATLDELVTDLAAAFEAEVEVVRDDVMELTRQVGRAGLLEGVAYEPPPEPVFAMPSGFAVGEPLPELRAPDLDGNEVALSDLRGRQVLVVNWSPRCGFCVNIAPDLAELQPGLRERGVEMVLLTFGEVEENLALLQEHQLQATVLVVDPGENEVFPGIGTPSAYLVDEEGKVASELQVGADRVPELARSAAAGAEVTDSEHI